MKANEAPEKIYLFENPITETPDYRWLSKRSGDDDIEYTRTDAFIEKAEEWLSHISIEDMTYKYNDFDTSEGWYKMIEDFKNYMKGE